MCWSLRNGVAREKNSLVLNVLTGQTVILLELCVLT